MMNGDKFDLWCLSNGIPDKGKAFISRIRNSQPSRAVGNRLRNVKGSYPSEKNGFTVQFESHTVELCGIYTYEYDPDVLEFYDQPEVLHLSARTEAGKATHFEYHPDFLALTKTGAFLDEWKTEDQLVKLANEYPERYRRDENGVWHFLPGEDFASGLGLQFRVRSSADINYSLFRNLQFLEDYLRYDALSVTQETESLVTSSAQRTPGIALHELIERLSGQVKVDDIYIMIATRKIFMDLETYLFVEPDYALVFPDKETADAVKIFDAGPATLSFQDLRPVVVDIGQTVIWDSVPMIIEFAGASSIVLKGRDEKVLKIEKSFFDKFVREGIITGLTSPAPALRESAMEIILSAARKDLAEANRRYQIILPHIEGERIRNTAAPERTVRRYLESYRHAKRKYGYGYVGLLPQKGTPGRKQSNLPDRTLELFEDAKRDYKSNKQKGMKSAYRNFSTRLENEGLQKVSLKSFKKRLRKTMTKHEETAARKGEKAAYQFEDIDWTLNVLPRHGDWPFHLAHVDNTLMDIELCSSKTGKVLGKMWVSKLIDANTRRYLAVTTSFDPPSYRSTMSVIRECVRRYGRLPHTIITDNGKEFDNVYFESLVAYFRVIRKLRPPASPRFGSIQERLIGTMNTNFLYDLRGNTQITKNVRQVTKAVNPKRLAIWTPLRFYERLCEWAYEVYDTMEHSALGMSPREAFERDIAASGHREHLLIPYDINFYMMTLPSTDKGTAKVQPGLGVKINGIYYNCKAFKDGKVENTSVEVRYEPYNLGITYAYVNGTWTQCRSQYYNVFAGKSERDMNFYSQELLQRMRLQNKDFTHSAKQLAEFILSMEAEENEALELRRLRNAENKAMLKRLDIPAVIGEDESDTAVGAESSIDDDSEETITIYEEVAL